MQPSLASAWQYPGSSNSIAQEPSTAERMGSLGRTGSLQAPAAPQPRSYVVTTGDIVVRSSSGMLEQAEAPCEVSFSALMKDASLMQGVCN